MGVFPAYTYGMGIETMRQTVESLLAEGAALIVVLSQNGFVKDMQMARLVNGIDVILSSGDELVTPESEVIGKTHIIASGGHGRFISRLDIDLADGETPEFQHTLIPVFSDLIAADADIAEIAQIVRGPFEQGLDAPLGTAKTVLARGGTFQASWDNLICQALLHAHGAEIALCPGVQWGSTLLPGQTITRADVYNVSAVPSAKTGVVTIAGSALKELLELSAEEVFAVDPLARSGLEMLRAGGLVYTIAPGAAFGQRIRDIAQVGSGQPIDPARDYRVASWGLPLIAVDGPDLSQVLEAYISERGEVGGQSMSSVKVV